MNPLVKTKKLIGDQGMTFENAFATTPVCCPSRASLLTGRYPHNTATTNNSIAGNCGGKAWIDKMETKNTFAAALKTTGYNTMYAGKYMNRYGTKAAGGVSQIPVGWDHWAGLVGNSRYYDYTLSVNGKREVHGHNYKEDYLTDVIKQKALEFLESWDKMSPFLMVLATPASHAPFLPAPQYEREFSNLTAPRIESYNRYSSDKHWFMRMKPETLSESARAKIDDAFRNRWRTLLSVDDLVEEVLHELELLDELDSTYVFYTSDHGYHLGEFGRPIDKRLPYEFDIRVPFLMRGPGLKQNTTSTLPVLLIDLAPTFLDIAGIKKDEGHDGVSILQRLREDDGETRDFLIEYSGEGGDGIDPACSQYNTGEFSFCSADFDCKCEDVKNNTYACVRSISESSSTMYCEFADDEKFVEFYNLKTDPYQLKNLGNIPSYWLPKEEMNSRLKTLKSCVGKQCRTTFENTMEPTIELLT